MTTATSNIVSRQPAWSDKPLFWITDYETFLKLKALHKWYYQTIYDVARWVRWDRKTVNQTGPEPKYCSLFVEEKGHWKKTKHRQEDEVFEGMVYYPKTLDDLGIVDAYQAARTPCETLKEAETAAAWAKINPEKINALYEEAKEFFE